MKTIIIILFCTQSLIFSQGGWQLIYHGNTLISPVYREILFLNELTGYNINEYGLNKTTNASQTWNIIYPGSTIKCYYLYNENIIWVLGNNKVSYTSNGGLNWIITDTTVSTPLSVCFINSLTGWVCGNNGMIKKTTNGGFTWLNQTSGTSENLKTISFYNSSNGVCAGDWGKILYTSNSGNNWNVFNDPYLGFFKYSKYLNENTAFISGNGTNIYRTTNNGTNWNISYVNASVISSINFNSSGRGFAFGSAHDIFSSLNNGINWERMNQNGLNSNVYSASITPNGTIWVAADSSMILNSTNSGESWKEIIRNYITKDDITSIFFINQLSGFACGNRGVLIKTTNGGINWNHIGFNTQNNLKGVKFIDNSTGFVWGGNSNISGIIYKTTNYGLTWINQFSDTTRINSLSFINDNTGWAAGTSGTLLKTTNGGSNWNRTVFQDTTINYVNFINQNTGFICSRKIFKTTNSGLNWNQVLNSTGLLIQLIGNNGYALSRLNNSVYFNKSTDLGETWNSFNQGSSLNFSMNFVNSETGWLSNGSAIRRTTNGGINWVIQTGTEIPVLTLFFIDTEHGWAAGNYGGIIRTISGGIGINQISTEIPRQFYLHQNYPNPFNPVTKIRFSIPLLRGVTGEAGRGVLLKIYNVLGKEIAVLVNENLKPGVYEIDWNAENIPSGVYFYSLITTEFTQTKKMVVVK